MRPLVIVSHTYVEPANRGKLHALAARVPVTAVVPRRWRDATLHRRWRLDRPETADNLRVVPARWVGPAHAALGVLRVPASLVAAPAVVQVEEEPWTPTAWRIARAGVPAFLFTWENVARALPWPWRAWRRAVFAKLTGLLAGSGGAADVARAQGYQGPVAVIPQLGVDLPAPRPRSERDRLRIAYVGRLVPEKGVDTLLEALRQVAESWRLDVVGEGPARRPLEALAARLALPEGAVRFHGARPHTAVADLWPEVDVLVLPSRTTPRWREQLGHVLLEAMAHEVAVVGSDSGAIPEVIGQAGLVFPEGSVPALAALLTGLARNPERVATYAAAGRARVAAQFTNDVLAARTLEFHAGVLG